MKTFGTFLLFAGFLILAGTVGQDDYWEACHRAVNCVAGEPMSLFREFIQLSVGIVMMALGAMFVLTDGE